MPREYISARDSTGHGTHTASTVGGSSVSMASVLGSGAGVARGMAPGAHIAVYKVCWFNGCYSSDILAAIDVAIQDKVDVLSLSLGGFPIPLYDDTIAIGIGPDGRYRCEDPKFTEATAQVWINHKLSPPVFGF